MKTNLSGAMIAAGLFCGPLAGEAMAEPEIVKTAPEQSLASVVAEQAARIDQQNAAITALQDQVRELSTILSARVDKVEAATESGKVVATNPGPRIESPNSKNTFAFLGAVQATVGLVDQSPDGAATPRLHGGTDIRRARIGVQGTAFNDFAYQAEIDLAQTTGSASAAARDAWVQYNGFRPFALTVGNMKPQTGMEASFSDRSNAGTFIESSMLSSMITSTGARNVGLRVSTGGKNWSGSLGYFGDDVNNNGVALPVNEGAGVHWRLTYAPILSKGKLLHLGTSGYYRDVATGRISTTADPLAGQLRVRAQPEYAIDTTRVIDTGNLAFADTVQVYGLEAAGFYGPVGFQAEYAKMDVSQNAGRPDLSFDGAYAGVNWFLTGESRNYEPRTGVFTRMSPKANLDPSSGTWGAFEVAARWSTLDLNSNPTLSAGPTLLGVRGGEATNYTVGVNWYWNPYLRLMLDYVTADVDNRTNTLPGMGALEGGEFNTLALRVQQEW